MGKTFNTGYLQNIIQYDGSNNIILPSLIGTGTRIVVAAANGTLSSQTASTTNIAEGTNLYYTDARVATYLSTNTYATQSYVTTAVSNLVDSAPGTLDTLNELAAALGDDPNFATTVATSIGTKQAQLNGTGFVKVAGTTVSYDNSTYLTTASASAVYVPYTGANANLDLGQFKLFADTIHVNGSGVNQGSYLGFKHATNVTSGADGYTSMYTFGTNTINYKSVSGATTKDFSFSMASITAGVSGGRVYTLPDASGTLALTSNLTAYLPLAGGTLTGALNGTSAVFSGAVQAGAISSFFSGGAGTAGQIRLGYDSTAFWQIGRLDPAGTGSGNFQFKPNAGTSVFDITTTGAATFTTTTYNGITISTPDVVTLKMTTSGNTVKNWGFATTNFAASDFGIYQSNSNGGDPINAGAAKLYFTSTGAATFSSSVSIPSISGLILGQTAVTDGIISSVSSTVGLNFKIGTTSALYIQGSATPNVGIGTTLPSAALNVSNVPTSFFGIIETTGTSAGTVKHFRVHKPGYVEYGIGILTNNSFHISTASTFPTTNGFTITSTGNVGIGVTPSAWSSSFKALQVGTVSLSQNNNVTAYVGSNWVSESGGDKYIVDGASAIYAQNSGNHIWYNSPSGAAGASNNFTERMRITAEGNVGIGTATIIGKLTVKQTLGDGGITGGITLLNDNNELKGGLFAGGSPPRPFGHLFLRDASNVDAVVLRTTGGENYLLHGNFGIGTALPAAKLQINNHYLNRGGRILTSNNPGWAVDGQFPSMVISDTTTSTSIASQIGLALHNDSQTNNIYAPVIVFSRKSNSGEYNSAFVALMAQATGQGADSNWVAGDFIVATTNQGSGGDLDERFRITSSGAATLTGALTQNASDLRLKNNVKNIENALDKLTSLNGVTFDWNETAILSSFIPRIQYNDAGIIAQEVQKVLPQAVDFAPFDRQNGKSKSGENYLTVQYEKLLPLLIEGIKELKSELDIAKAEIELLKQQ